MPQAARSLGSSIADNTSNPSNHHALPAHSSSPTRHFPRVTPSPAQNLPDSRTSEPSGRPPPKTGHIARQSGHIPLETEHIGPKTGHIRPKTGHIGRKLSTHWPAKLNTLPRPSEHIPSRALNARPPPSVPRPLPFMVSRPAVFGGPSRTTPRPPHHPEPTIAPIRHPPLPRPWQPCPS